MSHGVTYQVDILTLSTTQLTCTILSRYWHSRTGECVRLMRHQGMRMVVSTQSPCALPEEMLELATIVVVHAFQSRAWFDCLRQRLPMPESMFAAMLQLQQGEAAVFARQTALGRALVPSSLFPWHIMNIRDRLTADGGRSVKQRTCIQ